MPGFSSGSVVVLLLLGTHSANVVIDRVGIVCSLTLAMSRIYTLLLRLLMLINVDNHSLWYSVDILLIIWNYSTRILSLPRGLN